MALELFPTQPKELGDVARFLQAILEVSADAPFLDPALLEWRFFEPRPDWGSPRSYLLKQDGRIVAHSCIWPVQFLSCNGEVSSMHLIDWGACKAVAGAGIFLNQELMKKTDTTLGIGGSAMARRIAPKIGFAPCGSLSVYARVIRPWRQFRSDPRRSGWKGPARLLRNTAWSWAPTAACEQNWSAIPIRAFDSSVNTVLSERSSFSYTLPVRTAEMLNYILRCPTVVTRAFLLYEQKELRGYFLLARAGRQTRISDLWVNSRDEGVWANAYSLAARNAAADPEAYEVTAFSSLPLIEAALRKNGFRLRDTHPVLMRDPRKQMDPARSLSVGALESDRFYLFEPSHPFLT